MREESLGGVARRLSRPVVWVNQVGCNDGLIHDGRSLAFSAQGAAQARAEAFREDLILFDTESGSGDVRPDDPHGGAEIFRALVLGIRDTLGKCGISRAVLGLSGGVDSAVVAVLAAEALGADKVWALAMPSRYSAPASLEDAQLLARTLGVHVATLPITDLLDGFRRTLQGDLGEVALTVTEENLQARIRANLIMAFANQLGAMALATGNKSELATGCCTLYGDMAGGLAPIGDLTKAQVYLLAREINRAAEVIPRRTLERAPSAELRPDQTDQDILPAYEVLDPILELRLRQGLEADAIAEHGFDPVMVERVIALIEASEFKRRQAAPVLQASAWAFGARQPFPVRGRKR